MSLFGSAGGIGYLAVPTAVALEAMGVPLPGESTLIAGAVLAARGQLDIAAVIALAAVGAIMGDNAGYLLGRRLGRRALLAAGPLAHRRRRLLEAGDRFFAAHGAAAVFLGRWVAFGRVAIAWLAGADRMPWRRFLVWNAFGGVAWATSVGLAAYALGAGGARWLALAGTLAAIATLVRLAGLRRALAGMRSAARRLRRALRWVTRRRVAIALSLGAAATGFAVFVLPEIAGAGAEWRRVRRGDPAWLAAATTAELPSFAGYVALLHAVFGRVLRWRDSFLITMAGVAATRLFATAGAGGIALTSWALHRLGVPARSVGRGMVAFLATLYVIYLAALVVFGLALGAGLLPGGQAWLTLLPAGLAAGVVALALAIARSPGPMERRLARVADRAGPLRPPLGGLATLLHEAGDGIALALALVRGRPAVLLGAIAWWGFDIAALAAAFHAFGSAPPPAVLVMSYFLGTLGNLLPLPGGVGGIEGGMVGAFLAFGQPAGPALLAVLAYRLVSFWLPTAIGAPAYVLLHRTLGPRPSDSRHADG